MPTALTTATARQDLIEAAVHVAGLVRSNGYVAREELRSPVNRISVLVARYLNTLRLDPDTGAVQHEELDVDTKALLDSAVSVGTLNLVDGVTGIDAVVENCVALRVKAAAYLAVQVRKHQL